MFTKQETFIQLCEADRQLLKALFGAIPSLTDAVQRLDRTIKGEPDYCFATTAQGDALEWMLANRPVGLIDALKSLTAALENAPKNASSSR